ncbi:MAG: hypothetical protein AAF919_16040 [Pseudomonadota bacterium]
MDTRTAVAISGTAHAGLLVWALIGGLFQPVPDDDALQVTSVSVLSNAEFETLIRAPEPAEPETPAAPAPPTPREEPTPPPAEEAPPEVVRPDPPETTEPDAEPEVAVLMPPDTEVQPDPPDAPTTPADAPDAPVSDTPAPREAPTIAPTPAPAPPPATEVAPEVQAPPEPSEEPEPEPAGPVDEPAAPEETAPVVAREDETPSAAPEQSPRPGRKPAAPAPVLQAEVPEEPSENAPESDPIQDAVREALDSTATASNDAPAAPAGPPLTQGERDGLRVAVSRCWNLGSLSTEAMRTRVTIFMEMTQDGLPRTDTIRMIAFDGGSEAAARQAYEAGRRAIIRCADGGFDLPPEKYEHWREIEMTFNPEEMRAR